MNGVTRVRLDTRVTREPSATDKEFRALAKMGVDSYGLSGPLGGEFRNLTIGSGTGVGAGLALGNLLAGDGVTGLFADKGIDMGLLAYVGESPADLGLWYLLNLVGTAVVIRLAWLWFRKMEKNAEKSAYDLKDPPPPPRIENVYLIKPDGRRVRLDSPQESVKKDQ